MSQQPLNYSVFDKFNFERKIETVKQLDEDILKDMYDERF